ncbi:hypothetical protein KC19_9G160200 [Ceratodon purpureus]|uniref:Domain X domain-containing protein n=1 Tax=Ceratodon purpureus TaxID=3225 RepID=A0A8T0GSG8_CERPU|nr:hypothetical protein KC19_9G160200 [Ceratodon purpureus]
MAMARSHLLRLVRHASHALASHSPGNAASSGASLPQCRRLMQMRVEFADVVFRIGEEEGSLVMERQRSGGSRIGFGSHGGVAGSRAFRSVGHEEEGLLESVGDSDAGSGSEVEEYEWEGGEGDDEGEDDVEDLEALGSDSDDVEELSEPREPRKANGRDPDYSMRIEAPIDEIYALLHSRGFITLKQKRPTPNDSVLGQEDHRIVSWYRRVSVGLLNYYSCCDNFLKVKAMVNYQLRWSAIHTLSKKHKSSSRQVIQKYGKNLVVTRDGKTVASFLSVEEIKKHRKGFLEINPVPPETLIDVLYTRMKRRSREEKKKHS